MPGRYLLESGSPDGYLLEDSSGVLLLDDSDPPYVVRSMVEHSLSSLDQTTIDAPNFTALAGDMFIAVVFYTNTTAVTITLSDTVGSNDTWTQAESGIHEVSPTSKGLNVFYLTNAAAGSCTVRASMSAAVNDLSIMVVPVANLAASPFDDAEFAYQVTPSGTDAITTANVVLSAQPQMIFGVSVRTSGLNIQDVGTGFTNIGTAITLEGIAPARARLEHKRVTSTTGTAATFTGDALRNYISATVAFKEYVTPSAAVIPTINMAPPIVAGARW